MKEKEKEELSILAEKSRISLQNNTSDKTAAILKATLGTVPLIGSVLQEAVTVIIPNQRIDRIAQTMELFAEKIKDLDEEFLRQKMHSEEFTDLLEDAIPQAARSLSEDRRNYIASILKNSLTEEELDHIHEKKLLSILGELNDAEIIFLRYESLRRPERDTYYENHETILSPIRAGFGSPRIDHEKNAFRTSFREKLYELGLTRKEFVSVKKGQLPEIDEKTGMLKVRHAVTTRLGRTFLRYIGFPSPDDEDYDNFQNEKREGDSVG